jgi:S1-C subfamily serine protease
MLVTACVITVISAGCTAGLSAPVSTSASSPAAADANARPAAANGIVHEFSALVQQDGPAVVNISATPNAKHGTAELERVSPGDIVLQVNHVPVSDAAQFHQKMKDAGNAVALLVLHDGQRMFVPLDLG